MKTTYDWGYALSGGGARGFAHLGALAALEEYHVRPDIVAGTSIGAVVGAFYADGYTPIEIFRLFHSVKLRNLVASSFPRGGLFKSTGLQQILEKNLRARSFRELHIPLRVIASDIEEGKAHCFSEGELIPAILASCTVPVVFTPVEIDGHFYVDGGMFDNFPVQCIRKECRRIVGVNVSPVVKMKYNKSLRYVIERSMNYMVGSNTVESIKLCDYLISSDEFSKRSIFDTKDTPELFREGYRVTKAYLGENRRRLNRDIRRKRTLNGFAWVKNFFATEQATPPPAHRTIRPQRTNETPEEPPRTEL